MISSVVTVGNTQKVKESLVGLLSLVFHVSGKLFNAVIDSFVVGVFNITSILPYILCSDLTTY
jgi:hypothetical protein